MSAPTLLTPYGYSSSTCGYCTSSGTRSRSKSSSKYGMVASQMVPDYYQTLIDRGWRRSGEYVYHPDMARTCCPQYTIRLHARSFKPGKKHRQVVNRFNRYLETGSKPGELDEKSTGATGNPSQNGEASGSVPVDAVQKGNSKQKHKQKQKEVDAIEALHNFEVGLKDGTGHQIKHKFETQLIPAKATKETFELYKMYQVAVHKDRPQEVTMRGFERFLCSKTLVETPITYGAGQTVDRLPTKYGAYHLLYRIDGQLIGVSVIDILPKCVSSVYFIWHPDYAWASLGKLSAMYELDLARRMGKAGAEGMEWLYMGYWIPDCQKMRYKSEYAPSYLLDPGTNSFHLLNSKLEKYLISHTKGYRPFADVLKDEISKSAATVEPASDGAQDNIVVDNDQDSESDGEDDEEDSPSSFPTPPPPSFSDPNSYSEDEIDDLLLLMSRGTIGRRQVYQVSDLTFANERAVKREIRELLATVGKENMASSEGGIKGKAVLYFG